MNPAKATASLPLVSVICLCYNQGRFVRQALDSVRNQTYPNVELIIVDDGSQDDSVTQIQSFLQLYPGIPFLHLPTNRGTCAAFNQGLRLAQGEYIVDLAADDVLLPNRIARQVEAFRQLDDSYGVVFTDVLFIDEKSVEIGAFYPRNPDGSLRNPVPSGNIYPQLIRSHIISSPSMLSRKKVYDELEGYDESLSYEDFDFWVRSSRKYKYFYLDEKLTQKRIVKGSHSTHFYKPKHNRHLQSTLTILKKAFLLNQSPEEHQALAVNIRYHLRQSLFTENYQLVLQYAGLLKQVSSLRFFDYFLTWLAERNVPVFTVYRLYLKIRYSKSKGL
jgi:glycosyltransferase involved in cell wall biosynthesis